MNLDGFDLLVALGFAVTGLALAGLCLIGLLFWCAGRGLKNPAQIGSLPHEIRRH